MGSPTIVDYAEVKRLMAEGRLSNAEIARAVGCCASTIDKAAARLGMQTRRRRPGPKVHIDKAVFFALWHDAEKTKSDIAFELGISTSTVDKFARDQHLGKRAFPARKTKAEFAPDNWCEPPAPDSLALCSWVQQRIATLQIKEKHYAERRAEVWVEARGA
jgi:predicted transcriptional regulator